MNGPIGTSEVVFKDILIPGKSLLHSSNESIDLFIIAAGFEDRTVGVINLLQKNQQLENANIFVGKYQTNKRENEQAFEKVKSYFPQSANIIYCDADNAQQTCVALEAGLQNTLNSSTNTRVTVVFDISGSSSFLSFR